jgi:hypothetical protein
MFLFPSVLFGGSVILAIVMARAGITHMLKLTDKKGKVHFAGFYDKKGFEGVLNRLGKSGLFA